jgi:hypothetical protein
LRFPTGRLRSGIALAGDREAKPAGAPTRDQSQPPLKKGGAQPMSRFEIALNLGVRMISVKDQGVLP